MLQLDHFRYTVPNLDAGMHDIVGKLGAQPEYGGRLGTHNALLSLGASQYLEIIAPDPAQSGTAGDLEGFSEAAITGWVVQTDDFAAVEKTCSELGLACRKVAMSRNTPAGPTLNWELLFVSGHGFDDLFPVFVDWLESPHPAATTLQGGTLASFIVETRRLTEYRDLIAAFGIEGIVVTEGPDRLRAELISNSGASVSLP